MANGQLIPNQFNAFIVLWAVQAAGLRKCPLLKIDKYLKTNQKTQDNTNTALTIIIDAEQIIKKHFTSPHTGCLQPLVSMFSSIHPQSFDLTWM